MLSYLRKKRKLKKGTGVPSSQVGREIGRDNPTMKQQLMAGRHFRRSRSRNRGVQL